MRSRFVIPAVAVFATALAAPAYAQYAPVYGPGYYRPAYGGPTYRARGFRGAYYRGPMIEPFFYGDGWVPEPIFDHSRTGGIDPNIRPSN
jgi:hypothetical protein